MSGEPEATETIAVLAAQGYEASQVTFSDGSTWVSVAWLRVPEEQDDSETAGAIAKTVLSVDPGARRI
jgi:hypothetical protein